MQRNGLVEAPALPPPHLASDVYETVDGDAYVVEIAVPGLDPAAITIDATAAAVTVRTQPNAQDAQQNGQRYLLREQQVEPQSRVFEFPTEINPDEVSAKLEAGMLRIHVPKAAAARRRIVPLQRH